MISQTRADNRNDHNDHNDCVASAQELRNVTQKTSFEKKNKAKTQGINNIDKWSNSFKKKTHPQK